MQDRIHFASQHARQKVRGSNTEQAKVTKEVTKCVMPSGSYVKQHKEFVRGCVVTVPALEDLSRYMIGSFYGYG